MFCIGKKYFVSLDDYEYRYFEVNPKDLIISFLREFLSKIPKDETSKYTFLGNESYENDDFNSALESYSQALEFNQDNLEALFFRSMCFIKIEKYEDAVSDLTRLIEIKPDFIIAYFYRGTARASIQTYNHLKAAIIDFSTVIKNSDTDGVSYFIRAYCHLLLKQERSAKLDWLKAKCLGVTKENEENWKKDYFD